MGNFPRKVEPIRLADSRKAAGNEGTGDGLREVDIPVQSRRDYLNPNVKGNLAACSNLKKRRLIDFLGL
jgi:hypothetical protein